MKLLLSADLHLGRQSSRVGDRSSHTAIACWHRMVSLAIEHGVDAVLLAGDVVEQRNKRFESYGPLSNGISRLAKSEITTIAVSGNHDFDVLPPLVDSIAQDRFFLLGRNGRWESKVFIFGDESLQVDGWCFPSKRVPVNPLETYLPEEHDVDLHLGMVHGDLEATDSRYAPITIDSLAKTNVAGWLLGHIHKPDLRGGSQPWILYPGSPQALDPGETGIHGVWVLDTELDKEPQRYPLSSVCYSPVEVDVSSCADDDVAGYVERALKEHGRKIVEQSDSELKIVSLRPSIIGDCLEPLTVRQDLKNLHEYQIEEGGVSIEVDKVTLAIRENLNPAEFAGQKNALAKAVQLLHELESGDYSTATKALLETYRSHSVKLSNNYASLDSVDEELKRESQVEQLQRQLVNIISAIREQTNV
ncbi:MAG: DNA repair exonuclease [Planctomycetota bacterium]|nr:DNA repair exonuclease [Planctomycetota bacterium]